MLKINTSFPLALGTGQKEKAARQRFFMFFLRKQLDKSECLVYSIAVCFIFIGNRKNRPPDGTVFRIDAAMSGRIKNRGL